MKSCATINNFHLNISGRLDSPHVLSLCCTEAIPSIPGVKITKDPEESLNNFVKMRYSLVQDIVTKNSSKPYDCDKCINFLPGNYVLQPDISYVNLSMYPSPCQCKCFYCGVHKNEKLTPEYQELYETLFKMLELGLKKGIIKENAFFQISPGEITIHPYKERIINLISGGGHSAIFYTNAFIFDKDIARCIKHNGASINVSIDSGTADTWARVKGVDNFSTVVENIRRYAKINENLPSAPIVLKYIIFPGINDSEKDFTEVVSLCQELKVTSLSISRDVRKKYEEQKNVENNVLLESAARLLVKVHLAKLKTEMSMYSVQEQEKVINIAGNILAQINY